MGYGYKSVFQIYYLLPPKISVFVTCHCWKCSIKNLQCPQRFATILKNDRLNVDKSYIFVFLKSLAFQWYHFYHKISSASCTCIFSSSILRPLFFFFHFEFIFKMKYFSSSTRCINFIRSALFRRKVISQDAIRINDFDTDYNLSALLQHICLLFGRTNNFISKINFDNF